jgi:hypothetical protein
MIADYMGLDTAKATNTEAGTCGLTVMDVFLPAGTALEIADGPVMTIRMQPIAKPRASIGSEVSAAVMNFVLIHAVLKDLCATRASENAHCGSRTKGAGTPSALPPWQSMELGMTNRQDTEVTEPDAARAIGCRLNEREMVTVATR